MVDQLHKGYVDGLAYLPVLIFHNSIRLQSDRGFLSSVYQLYQAILCADTSDKKPLDIG
jgi:hypothetical protein